MDEQQLTQAIYDFTASVLEKLAAQGLLPRMVAVGNELSNGLLWPWGRTPRYIHTDRKLLQKLREKKIAHGHKPDDHAPTLS